MARHNVFGERGELLAANYLLDKGYYIEERNWRSGHKEIDIIARQRDILVFVEVKSRSSDCFGNVADAVTSVKMCRLFSAAEAYILQRKIDAQYRFDIVTVVSDGERYRIEHIEDAFSPSW